MTSEANSSGLSVAAEGRRDEDIAAELAARMRAALGPVCAIIAEARGYGMNMNFAVGQDMLGRIVVQQLQIVKVLMT